MREKKKQKLAGAIYYRKMGFTKSLIVHLKPSVAVGLRKIAVYEERAVQTVIRRIIETYVSTRLREIKGEGGEHEH